MLVCVNMMTIIIFSFDAVVSFAYPIHQSNSFPESDNKLLILKGSLFSVHGLGAGGMGRGTESIRPFREELPVKVRDYKSGEVRKPLPDKACSAGRRHKKGELRSVHLLQLVVL
jgi:hypothetical protein